MPDAQHLRAQIEASLAKRIPSALSPVPRTVRPVSSTGVPEIDHLLDGGFPLGAITELAGAECSGRTSLALNFVAMQTKAEKVCAWVDVSDVLHPETAAAIGVDLSRLLWTRCGAATPAIPTTGRHPTPRKRSWNRLDQALRVTDLLLQAGGFSCIVLDMGSIPAEFALRVPLATWFRFRAAAERLQMHFVLLTQHTCSKSSAGVVLRLTPGRVMHAGTTVFTGLEHGATMERQRFQPTSTNVLPIRKPPRSTHTMQWQSHAVWSGR